MNQKTSQSHFERQQAKIEQENSKERKDQEKFLRDTLDNEYWKDVRNQADDHYNRWDMDWDKESKDD